MCEKHKKTGVIEIVVPRAVKETPKFLNYFLENAQFSEPDETDEVRAIKERNDKRFHEVLSHLTKLSSVPTLDNSHLFEERKKDSLPILSETPIKKIDHPNPPIMDATWWKSKASGCTRDTALNKLRSLEAKRNKKDENQCRTYLHSSTQSNANEIPNVRKLQMESDRPKYSQKRGPATSNEPKAAPVSQWGNGKKASDLFVSSDEQLDIERALQESLKIAEEEKQKEENLIKDFIQLIKENEESNIQEKQKCSSDPEKVENNSGEDGCVYYAPGQERSKHVNTDVQSTRLDNSESLSNSSEDNTLFNESTFSEHCTSNVNQNTGQYWKNNDLSFKGVKKSSYQESVFQDDRNGNSYAFKTRKRFNITSPEMTKPQNNVQNLKCNLISEATPHEKFTLPFNTDLPSEEFFSENLGLPTNPHVFKTRKEFNITSPEKTEPQNNVQNLICNLTSEIRPLDPLALPFNTDLPSKTSEEFFSENLGLSTNVFKAKEKFNFKSLEKTKPQINVQNLNYNLTSEVTPHESFIPPFNTKSPFPMNSEEFISESVGLSTNSHQYNKSLQKEALCQNVLPVEKVPYSPLCSKPFVVPFSQNYPENTLLQGHIPQLNSTNIQGLPPPYCNNQFMQVPNQRNFINLTDTMALPFGLSLPSPETNQPFTPLQIQIFANVNNYLQNQLINNSISSELPQRSSETSHNDMIQLRLEKEARRSAFQ